MRGNSEMGARVVHQSPAQKKKSKLGFISGRKFLMNAWKQLHLGEIGREIEGKSREIGDGLGEIGLFCTYFVIVFVVPEVPESGGKLPFYKFKKGKLGEGGVEIRGSRMETQGDVVL